VLRLQGLGLCDLKPDRCVILRHNDSYPHLMEDQDPRLHYHPSQECFVAETSNGHFSSASDSGETPERSPWCGCGGDEGPTSGGSGLSPTTARMTTVGVAVGTAA
jgi:hypothetical protein